MRFKTQMKLKVVELENRINLLEHEYKTKVEKLEDKIEGLEDLINTNFVSIKKLHEEIVSLDVKNKVMEEKFTFLKDEVSKSKKTTTTTKKTATPKVEK